MADSALTTVYKAWRAALIASETLTALIPAANIYMGPRRADQPVPAISITIFESTQTITQGVRNQKYGYFENAEATLKIELAKTNTLSNMLAVYDAIYAVLLQDNATLNASCKQITKLRKEPESYNERELLEGNLTFGFKYSWYLPA